MADEKKKKTLTARDRIFLREICKGNSETDAYLTSIAGLKNHEITRSSAQTLGCRKLEHIKKNWRRGVSTETGNGWAWRDAIYAGTRQAI